MIRPDGKPHHPEDGWDTDGKPLCIAWAPHVKVQEWAGRKAVTWDALRIDHRVFPSKDSAPLWSPVILSSMARCLASVTHAGALAYDFDRGTKWEDVIDVLDVFGIRYWAYTTWSHSEEVHKFRVVLGVDEAIPAASYKAAWSAMRSMMQWDVDETCKDASRLFYVPSCSEGAKPWQAWGGDIAIDWRALIDWDEARKPPPTVEERVYRMAERRNLSEEAKREEATRRAFARALSLLDPDVGYHSWTPLGMIAKEIGMESEWVEWCKRGKKYIPGEPEKKLRSYRR